MHLFTLPFFRRRKKKSKSIIEVAEAKMHAIDVLTKNLPIGSTIPMHRVQEIAKKLGVDPEELTQKLSIQEGYSVYRD